MFKYIFLLGFVLCTGSVWGQSLEVIHQQIEDQNPALQALNQSYLAALERAPQVSQLPDPEFGLGLFPFPVETRLGAQQLRLSATQMFPWFGTLQQQQDLENAKAQAVYERIAVKRQELFGAVDQAYLQLYELQKRQSILEQQIQLYQSLESIALAKVASGSAKATDVLQVQLKLEELEQRIRLLEQKQAVPLATINQLRYADNSAPLQITDSLALAVLPFNQDSLLQYINQNHPLLRTYALEQEVVQQSLQLNDLQRKPSFGIGADYIAVAERDLATITDNGRDILQVRATVKVPLYRKQYDAREREQNLRISALQHQAAASESAFAASLQKAYTRHRNAVLEWELYDRQAELTRSIIDLLESDYSASGRGMDELIRYEQELINYQIKKLTAIVQSHLAAREVQQLLY